MFALLSSLALAQVNADVLASRVTTPGPSLGLDASAGLSAGNVTSAWWSGLIAVQLLSLHDQPPGPPPFFRDRAFVHASVRRASYDGEVVDDEALAHARYTRMWVPRFGTEVFGQLQYARFLLLSQRWLTGGGVRVDVIHHEDVGLWGGTGAMFEHETLSDGTVTQAVRSTSYVGTRWAIVPKRLTLSGTGYLQPRVDEPRDLRALVEARVESEVTGVLSIGTDLVYRTDTRPPEDVLSTDVRLGTSIKLRLSRRVEQ